MYYMLLSKKYQMNFMECFLATVEIAGEMCYTTDRQDLQWYLRESAWLAVCSQVVLQI